MSAILPIVAGAGSILASLFGAKKSSDAVDDAIAGLNKSHAAELREYDRLLARDEINDPSNQSLLSKLRELQRENYNRARATNVVAGGTDESLAMMQQAGNQVLGQTIDSMAARSGEKKDRIRAQKQASNRQHSQQVFGLRMQKAQNIAQAAGQMTGAMAGIAAASLPAANPFQTTGAAAASTAPNVALPAKSPYNTPMLATPFSVPVNVTDKDVLAQLQAAYRPLPL